MSAADPTASPRHTTGPNLVWSAPCVILVALTLSVSFATSAGLYWALFVYDDHLTSQTGVVPGPWLIAPLIGVVGLLAMIPVVMVGIIITAVQRGTSSICWLRILIAAIGPPAVVGATSITAAVVRATTT